MLTLSTRLICLSTPLMLTMMSVTPLQKTLAKLDSNIGQLEEKLAYERNKFVSYSKDLKEAETRCGPLLCMSLPAGIIATF